MREGEGCAVGGVYSEAEEIAGEKDCGGDEDGDYAFAEGLGGALVLLEIISRRNGAWIVVLHGILCSPLPRLPWWI